MFKKSYSSTSTERLSSYRLYAVVVHSGVLEGGHYVAYVKRRGRWFLCDDASVEPVSETRVLEALSREKQE